jgi:adenylate cyclase
MLIDAHDGFFVFLCKYKESCAMARVSVTINNVQNTLALTEKGLTIGRQLDNDIVLNHAIVSRHHARLELRGRQGWVVDLNSRNGIFVNRLRVKEEQLHDGDTLTIGPFELQFEDRAAQSVVFDDSQYFPLTSDERAAIRENELPSPTIDFREFYAIGMRLNQVVELAELLDLVMDEVLRLVPAERGILLLLKGQELVPRIIYPQTHGDVTISSTIVRKAIEGGEAILTRDARLDFGGSESIISANIRSAISAPMLLRGNPIGLIILDSTGQNKFTEEECDLVSAIATQAAVAIERANLTEELRQQATVRQNLERFLSPNVAQALARYVSQHGKLWEAQEQEVSVLFADITGFTALSETMSPQEVQDLLNEYLHEMTDVIFQHKGTVDKYIGDGIMAVFGAPRLPDEPLNEHHALDAVAAALEMQAAQKRLIEKLDTRKAFRIRVGVNTGKAYTGFFGTRHRLEYTAIGDTVNTASRLESKARPGTVCIGEETHRAIGDTFEVEELGPLELKGKKILVTAYEVLGRKSSV